MTDQELIKKWIVEDPFKEGKDEVRVKDYWVHVWALIGHGLSVKETAEDYEVSEEAVEAAYAYYRQNKEIIDKRIAENYL